MTRAPIDGWGHIEFGGLASKSFGDWHVKAGCEVLAHSNIETNQIDAITMAVSNAAPVDDSGLPIKRSGNRKANGHPACVTAVAKQIIAAKQLLHQAAAMQGDGAALGCVLDRSGTAMANDRLIRESVRSAP